MSAIRIGSIILLTLLGASHLFAVDVIHLRFSDATLSALAESQNPAIFHPVDRMPLPEYDRKTKKLITQPVETWLHDRAEKAKTLSSGAYKDLLGILLNPQNHFAGGGAWGDTLNRGIIQFTTPKKRGYIILHRAVIQILWEGNLQGALLNDDGIKALEEWVKQNP